ncbi:MAG: AIPR family protein [Metamycoplasmataceae bacterium]
MSQKYDNLLKESINNYLLDNKYLNKFKSLQKKDERKAFSQAFTLFCLEKIASLDHTKIGEFSKYIVDGTSDNGIDAIYFNDEKNILYVIQAKYSSNSKGISNELSLFKQKADELLKNESVFFNDDKRKRIVKETVSKYKAIHADTSVEYHFVSLVSDDQKNNNNHLIEKYNSKNYKYFLSTISNIISYTSPYRKVSKITLKINNEEKIFIKEKGLCLAIIKAKDLLKSFDKFLENETIFASNLRNPLNTNKLAKHIIETLENEPEQFVKYNNGITVVCEDIIPNKKDAYIMKGFSVVNGAQTLNALYKVNKKSELKDDCFIVMKILISDKETGNKISMNSNHQNVVKQFDNFSFHPINEVLYNNFFLKNIEYKFKRGGKKGKRKIIFAESILRLVSCFLSNSIEEMSVALSSSKNNHNFLYSDKNIYWKKNERYLKDKNNVEQMIVLYDIWNELKQFLKEHSKSKSVESGSDIEYLLFSMLLKDNMKIINSNDDYIKKEFAKIIKIEKKVNSYINIVLDKINRMLNEHPDSYKSKLLIMKNETKVRDLINYDEIKNIINSDNL